MIIPINVKDTLRKNRYKDISHIFIYITHLNTYRGGIGRRRWTRLIPRVSDGDLRMGTM